MLQRASGILLLVCSVLGAAAAPQRLKIGFGHVPPIQFADTTGRAAGFAVDVLNEAARREEIELFWIRTGGSLEVEKALTEGSLDLVPAGLVTAHRQQLYYVSDPWWSAELSIVTRASSGVFNAADLRNRRLAMASPLYAQLVRRYLPQLTEVAQSSAASAFVAMCRGEADGALMTQIDVQEQALVRPGACRDIDLRTVETNVTMELAIVARHEVEPAARRLRRRIDDMALDGKLAAMATWHPPTPMSGAVRLADTVRARYERRTLELFLLSAMLLLAVSGGLIFRQRRTQAALRHKSELLQSVVDTIPVMMTVHEPDRPEFSPNREFTRVLGWSDEDARSTDLMAACYPDPGTRAAVADFVKSGQPGWRDFKIKTKSGETVDTSWATIRLSDGTQVGIGIDLRERLRAEGELREAYNRFATLVENIPDVVFRLDRELRCVYASSAARSRGFTPEDPGIRAECREVLRTGLPRQFETVAGDRSHRIRIIPEPGQNGSVVSLLGIAEDVTDARQTERSLRDSERRWSLAVEYAGLGLWDIDLKTGKTVWTRRHYEVLGYEPDSFEPTQEIWQARLHPGDLHRVLRTVEHARRNRALYSCLHRVIRADTGAVVWLDAHGRFEYEDGEATRFIGIFVDVTHRKRAEAELAAMMDAVPAAILIARDPECRNVTGSRTTYDLFRAPVGSNLSKSIPGSTTTYRLQRGAHELRPEELPLRTAIRTGQPVRDYELDLVLEDGTARRLFGNAVPLLDEAGRPRGAVAAFTDVTELKRMEERLRHAQKLESIGLLAGGIAHDFNNILVSVVGSASLALEMLPPLSPVRELMQQVIASGDQASHLTRQMLAYAGKGRFVIGAVSVAEVARETVLLVQTSISKKILVRLDLPENLPPVEADRSQIQQVLMNLVLNAAEAIGEQAGVVTVRASAVDLEDTDGRRTPDGFDLEAGRYVVLEVQDTGCGMDPGTKARIFDPFFTTKFTGRGLGLAAVAGIVRAHRGALQVTTSPGEGSSFQVLFPAGTGRVELSPAAGLSEADLKGSGTVLVIDDEEKVREMAAKVLALYGYTVLRAADGASAIELLRQAADRVCAILLDLSMPGMSGEEVLPELRKILPDVAVVVSSGYSEVEAMRLFAGAPVAGFIQKPYTSKQLGAKMKSALRSTHKAAQG